MGFLTLNGLKPTFFHILSVHLQAIYARKETVMKAIYCAINSFWSEEDGVTAIEYGLLAALVGVAIITAATLMGTKMSEMFTGIANKLTAPS